MASKLETPKKLVVKRNSNTSVNDICRICKCSFKIEFGESRISFENLFKPSERKESRGLILASACEVLGLKVEKSPRHSERVCRPCGRKIRNAHDNFTFLKNNLNSESLQSPVRQKRQLPTTVTPERRGENGRSGKQSAERKGNSTSRKGLFADKENIINTQENITQVEVHDLTNTDSVISSPKENIVNTQENITEDEVHDLMNIDSVISNTKESQVRVFITYPNSRIVVKESFDRHTSSLIKNIALHNWDTAANIVFKHTEIREHLPKCLTREISTEFRSLSSDSILSGSSPEELAAFSNKILVHEVSVKCPFWSATLNGACSKSSQNHADRSINAMALATATLARSRNPKLSAHAYRISLLLFKSGASYYDTIRLNRLGVCMSPESIVNLQKKMGLSTDSNVLLWKKKVEENLAAQAFIKEVEALQLLRDEDDMILDEVEFDFSEETVKEYQTYNKSTHEYCLKLTDDSMKRLHEGVINESVLGEVMRSLRNQKLPLYKLVGDNIDYNIQARYQSIDRTNQSIHWTQQYAVSNRINVSSLDNSKPQMKLKDIQLVNLLPSNDVLESFKRNCSVLVSRVISKYIGIFKHMQDCIVRHIPHTHSEEMSQKSDICCLGLQFKNPNIAGEMAQLIISNQQKYVPCTVVNDTPQILMEVPLHGDQLFEERSRNVQWTFQDGTCKYDRLEGITTEAADWHAKVNLYSVCFLINCYIE